MPAGRLFESFDEAWAYFLARREPLEDFFADLPAEEREGEAWVIEPSAAIKAAAVELQRPLAGIDWLALLPDHFLHVSLPMPVTELRGKGPFELEYSGANCFHEAVVVQVEAPSLRALHPSMTFLPHMTLAITTREAPADELRDVVKGMRDAVLGREAADEAIRIAFPFSRERFLEAWTVRERMSLKPTR
jgi:hypothetical protein